jgi:hypothetical protein
MKRTSEITSVESKAAFHERLLEKFVQDNLPSKFNYESRLAGMGQFNLNYKEIESCAAETPVNGTIEIFFEADNPFALRRLSVPVSSRFFVFCTRDENENYKVTCSCSLS